MPRRHLTNNKILKLINDEAWASITTAFTQCHPADIADIIDISSPALHEKLFSLVSDKIKADVLANLEHLSRAGILEALTAIQISTIVHNMAPDDAADVLADLPEERFSHVLNLMEKSDSDEVRQLLTYEEDSAGGIMTPDVIAMHANQTVEEALMAIANLDEDDHFMFAYIIDENKHLIGSVDIWQLLRTQNKKQPLGGIAKRDFISAGVNTDQEEVAHLIKQYDLTSIPVVDNENRLVGRITADDVIDVMTEEASEDIFRLAGSDDVELESFSPLRSIIARLPWLFITLFGGMIVAVILKTYQLHVAKIAIMVSFVPSILGMGGNTGIQSSTLVVRRIALGTMPNTNILKLLLREMFTGAIMGCVCGCIIAAGAFIIARNDITIAPLYLALVVALALFSAMTFAATFGTIVPVLLHKMHIDPAIASGPFISVANDISALLIYFTVSVIMLHNYL